MEAFKKYGLFALILFIVAAAGYYAGKNSNPAKTVTAEVAKVEAKAESVKAEQSDGLVLAKKTTKKSANAAGDTKELTIEEYLNLVSNQKAEAGQSETKTETAKTVTELNSLLFVRGGVAIGSEHPLSPHIMASASYGAWEGVAHSDLKLNHWAGVLWGFGF